MASTWKKVRSSLSCILTAKSWQHKWSTDIIPYANILYFNIHFSLSLNCSTWYVLSYANWFVLSFQIQLKCCLDHSYTALHTLFMRALVLCCFLPFWAPHHADSAHFALSGSVPLLTCDICPWSTPISATKGVPVPSPWGLYRALQCWEISISSQQWRMARKKPCFLPVADCCWEGEVKCSTVFHLLQSYCCLLPNTEGFF